MKTSGITDIIIIRSSGTPDNIGIVTDVPNPFKDKDDLLFKLEHLVLGFTTPHGEGEVYVKRHWDIKPRVIFLEEGRGKELNNVARSIRSM